MRLLVTSPLNLLHTEIEVAIRLSGFRPRVLVVTEEFSRSHMLLRLSESKLWETIIEVPLCESDFGPCARDVRLFEMLNQSDAVLVVVSSGKMPPDGTPYLGEPGVKISALLNLAKKAHLEIKVIDNNP